MGKTTTNSTIDAKEVTEFLEILGRFNDYQKQIVLATLRGAVLIADLDKGA